MGECDAIRLSGMVYFGFCCTLNGKATCENLLYRWD